MSQQDPDRNTVNVSGGTHVGGVIGAGHVDSHVRIGTSVVGAAGQAVTIDELRRELAAAHDQIVGAATTADERDELVVELRKINRLLLADDPEPAPIKTRWQSVVDTLGVLGETGAIATITGMVQALFGSS